MAIGISTSCFYPMNTEDSLITTGRLNAGTVEIFFNSPSELNKDFTEKLVNIRDEYSLKVKSVHTYASFSETYYFFSSYERRFYDSLEEIKRYCESMNKLDAKILVMHGAKLPCAISDEEIFERFGKISEICHNQGIILAQENVVDYHSGNPEFLINMQSYLGDKFHMVLDIKQARRAGFTPYDFLTKLSQSVVHIHISDYNSASSCITPLEGEFDFKHFFKEMKSYNYSGDYIIELYQNSYTSPEQIALAKTKLENIF